MKTVFKKVIPAAVAFSTLVLSLGAQATGAELKRANCEIRVINGGQVVDGGAFEVESRARHGGLVSYGSILLGEYLSEVTIEPSGAIAIISYRRLNFFDKLIRLVDVGDQEMIEWKNGALGHKNDFVISTAVDDENGMFVQTKCIQK